MAVAGHCFDRLPAPPLLVKAWDFERYGINLLEMHAGTISGARMASNAYTAISGYRRAAGKTASWAKTNPDAWNFVAQVIELRREERLAARQEA